MLGKSTTTMLQSAELVNLTILKRKLSSTYDLLGNLTIEQSFSIVGLHNLWSTRKIFGGEESKLGKPKQYRFEL